MQEPIEEDRVFGQIVLKKGFVTQEQLQAALREKFEAAREGKSVRLGEILLKHGFLTFENLTQALEILKSAAVLECARCGTHALVLEYDAMKSYGCAKCTGKLKRGDAAPPSMPSQIFDSQRLPAEVVKAAEDPKNVFGKYVLLKLLGKGGMGAVYKAYDTALKRTVALKQLLGTEEEDLKRFMREAQTAAALVHPNICQVYEVGSIGGRHYIAMQYIDGNDLLHSKLSIRRALEVIKTIALALEAAHARGIVHRDIKPQNIMIDSQGKAFLLDFGLARAVRQDDKITVTGTVMGTPAFMSPEQAQGRPVDRRSDVYSLGATLYHAVTGRPPFHGETPLDTLRLVVDQDPVPPRQLNPKLQKEVELIILKAMQKDPMHRYASARDLAADIERYLKGENVLARGTTVVSVITRRAKKHRNVILSVVSTAVLAAVGVGIWVAAASSGRAREIQKLTEEAEKAFLQQRWGEAKAKYHALLKLDPENAVAREREQTCSRNLEQIEQDRIRAEAEAKKREQEAREAREREERERKMREAAQPLFDEGQAALEEAWRDFYRKGVNLETTRARLKTAVEKFSAAIDRYPSFHEAYHARGKARALLGHGEAAEQDLTRAIELFPSFLAAYRDRGMLYITRYVDVLNKMGWQSREAVDAAEPYRIKAVKDLEQLARLGAKEKEIRFVNALIAYAKGDSALCVQLCDPMLAEDPANEEVYKLRGDAYHRLFVSDPAETGMEWARRALQDYARALDLRVNFVDAYKMRAVLHYRLNDQEAALADLKAALAIAPADSSVHMMLGLWYSHMRNQDQALRHLNEAIRLGEDSVHVFNARGALYLEQKRFAEALEDFNRAVTLNPNHIPAVYHRGVAYYYLGRYEEAVPDLEKAMPHLPAQRERIQAILNQIRRR